MADTCAILVILALVQLVATQTPAQPDGYLAGVNAAPSAANNPATRRRDTILPPDIPRNLADQIGSNVDGILRNDRRRQSVGAAGQGSRTDTRPKPTNAPLPSEDDVSIGVVAASAPSDDQNERGGVAGDQGEGIVPVSYNITAKDENRNTGSNSNRTSIDSEQEGHGNEHEHGDKNNENTNVHEDHGHDHTRLDKKKVTPLMQEDLALNIVPLEKPSQHHHDHDHSNDDDQHWHMHGNRDSTSAPHSRIDKSLTAGNMDLCDYCLCDNKHTHISCEIGRTVEDTDTLTLAPSMMPLTAETLQVRGFRNVTVLAETFSRDDSRLRRIAFRDIDFVHLEQHSLHFSPNARANMLVTVSLTDCSVPLMPPNTLTQVEAPKGRHADDGHHTILGLEKTRWITLRMHRCHIGDMESHAMYRTRMMNFNFTDVTIRSMSHKSIDLDVYEEWVVQGSRLPHLPQLAICLHAEKSVVFSRNIIEELDPYAWGIEAGGQVLFEYNNVNKIRANAFAKITPMMDSRTSNIVFLNNTVISADAHALVTSDLYSRHERKVLNNRFNILCECNISVYFKEMLDIEENDTDDLELNEAVLFDSLCIPYPSSPRYMFIKSYLNQECTEMPIEMIIIASAVGVLMLASIVVAVVCARRAKKAQEEASYLGECSSRSFSTMNTHASPTSPAALDKTNHVFYDTQGNPTWVMAVPDVKTYQETEVHVTYEESHPIQNSTRSSYQDYMVEMQRRNNLTRQSCPFN